MNTSVSVVYYKSKTLNNSEHPLMLRIIKDRKTKYQSLGISIPLQHWDLSKNQPKRSCPNRDAILRLITKVNKHLKDIGEELNLELTCRKSNVKQSKVHSVCDACLRDFVPIGCSDSRR